MVEINLKPRILAGHWAFPHRWATSLGSCRTALDGQGYLAVEAFDSGVRGSLRALASRRWPGIEGQDFAADLRIPNIDFGTVHT